VHEIDVYGIRGGRVAEARSTSIEPCATGAFYVDESLDRAIHRPSSSWWGYVATMAWRASRRSPRTPLT
jgi:hypothetical protein